MAKLSTRFFGLDLKSPVIAGSSSLTAQVDQIEKLAKAGAGAIVLKSLFEEEIHLQADAEVAKKREFAVDPEYLDYFDYVVKDDSLKRYLNLIASAKSAVDVPIVASVNCTTSVEWVQFASKLEEAGADAIELNLFVIPSDETKDHQQHEAFYYETVKQVLEAVTIPVSIKISHYFSNLAQVVRDLSQTGIAGITLFNRFYTPDIDIYAEDIIGKEVLSSPKDYLLPLRWTAILSSKATCPLCGTSGIFTAETAIKFLLAGANAFQIASVIYKEGAEVITQINEGIERWMDEKGYSTIDEFKGSLCIKTKQIDAWERMQFMNYFGGFSY